MENTAASAFTMAGGLAATLCSSADYFRAAGVRCLQLPYTIASFGNPLFMPLLGQSNILTMPARLVPSVQYALWQ
jgi:hypothetical protein